MTTSSTTTPIAIFLSIGSSSFPAGGSCSHPATEPRRYHKGRAGCPSKAGGKFFGAHAIGPIFRSTPPEEPSSVLHRLRMRQWNDRRTGGWWCETRYRRPFVLDVTDFLRRKTFKRHRLEENGVTRASVEVPDLGVRVGIDDAN